VTSSGHGRRDRWLALAVPLVLVAVAVTQVVTASTQELTPWRGAGFGMFSTLDGHSLRVVRLTIEDDAGRSWPVDVTSVEDAPDTHARFVEARAFPTERRAGALASSLADADLVVVGDTVHVADGLAARDEDVAVPALFDEARTVTLEVYRLELDQPSGRVTPHEVAARTVTP
jgi:hypothetical protein